MTDQSVQEEFASFMIGDGFSEDRNGKVAEMRGMKAGDSVRQQQGKAVWAILGGVHGSQFLL